MPEITPTPPATSTNGSQSDEALLQTMLLQSVFQQALKKPEPSDDDGESAQSVVMANELNKTISLTMAQSIVGFGQ